MHRHRLIATGIVLLAGLSIYVTSMSAASSRRRKDPKAPQYLGLKGCKKCHQKASIGRQYNLWKNAKHAKAYETLKSDKAVDVARKEGLSGKPCEEPACLKCHTTAYGLPKHRYGPRYKHKEGVTCEACHGAAEFFGKPPDGKIHTEAFGKGYTKPEEKHCVKCHNEDSPTWDPERFTVADGKKAGFDFEFLKKEMAHPIPAHAGQKP